RSRTAPPASCWTPRRIRPWKSGALSTRAALFKSSLSSSHASNGPGKHVRKHYQPRCKRKRGCPFSKGANRDRNTKLQLETPSSAGNAKKYGKILFCCCNVGEEVYNQSRPAGW